MLPKFMLNGVVHTVEPVRAGHNMTLQIDGHQLDVRHDQIDKDHHCIVLNGLEREVYIAQDDRELFIHMDGRSWQLEALDEFADTVADSNSGGGVIRAPMPGVVLELNAAEGDEVRDGDYLLLIESMKLQTEIRSPIGGVIKSISVSEGDSFDKATVLIEVVSTEDTS